MQYWWSGWLMASPGRVGLCERVGAVRGAGQTVEHEALNGDTRPAATAERGAGEHQIPVSLLASGASSALRMASYFAFVMSLLDVKPQPATNARNSSSV